LNRHDSEAGYMICKFVRTDHFIPENLSLAP
jgi:hypothetical protein